MIRFSRGHGRRASEGIGAERILRRAQRRATFRGQHSQWLGDAFDDRLPTISDGRGRYSTYRLTDAALSPEVHGGNLLAAVAQLVADYLSSVAIGGLLLWRELLRSVATTRRALPACEFLVQGSTVKKAAGLCVPKWNQLMLASFVVEPHHTNRTLSTTKPMREP